MKPNWCDEIGEKYLNEKGLLYVDTDEVNSAYRKMIQVNEILFNQIDVPVIFQEDDPYEDYYDMRSCVEEEGKLRIYSKSNPEDSILSKDENLKSRAVHDYFGHLKYDVDFSPKGEFLKWYNSCNHYPPAVTQVLFSEVVCQTAVIHHIGSFDYKQRDSIAESELIEQVCDYYNKPVPNGTYYWD